MPAALDAFFFHGFFAVPNARRIHQMNQITTEREALVQVIPGRTRNGCNNRTILSQYAIENTWLTDIWLSDEGDTEAFFDNAPPVKRAK